ncbi:MAG: hypothetical protein Q9M31_07730 [Mariprofundus sp.]|nr:hypothetical protein [Mariprofundus sp.]
MKIKLVYLLLLICTAPSGAVATELALLNETKIATLLNRDGPYEASGVTTLNGSIYIVFDNMPNVLRSNTELLSASLSSASGGGDGFEGLAHDDRGHLLAMVEDGKHQRKRQGRVYSYDLQWQQLSKVWLPFTLQHKNKGFEGIEMLSMEGRKLLLALCEGNRCLGGKQGRKQGRGRIQVFQDHHGKWQHKKTIKLKLPFTDYSGMDVHGSRIAIVSQASSLLWVGAFDVDNGLIRVGQGELFNFPKDNQGRTVYCNIEGVSWLSDDRIVVISDRYKKKKQPRYCADKDQSVHIFQLPLNVH